MKVYNHSDYSYVTIVEVPHKEVEKLDLLIGAQPKEKLGTMYGRLTEKPDVLINAGFFALSTGEPCFNLVDDGTVYATNTKYRWGFGISKDHKSFEYNSIDNLQKKNNYSDFISGYPNLVDQGKSCAPWTFATEINYKAARSVAAYDDTNIYFITIGKPGMNFTTMATMLVNMGIKYAINLDGGGSSRLLVGGEVANTPTEDRAVDSMLALYLTEEAHNEYFGLTDYYTYTVVSGDSWWRIASQQLGNGRLYTKLKEYNEWGNKTLNPGDIIKIPNDKFQEKKEESVVVPDTIIDCATVKFNKTKNTLIFYDAEGNELYTISKE